MEFTITISRLLSVKPHYIMIPIFLDLFCRGLILYNSDAYMLRKYWKEYNYLRINHIYHTVFHVTQLMTDVTINVY